MASKRLWCSVLRCNKEHSSHLDVPKSEPLKKQWLSFVFEDMPKGLTRGFPHGYSPRSLCFHVCANHFTPDSFTNEKKRIGTNVFLLNLQKITEGRGEQSSLSFKDTCTETAC
ncbi:hypothetical protein PO909_029498 [Leuciscus waleckii]